MNQSNIVLGNIVIEVEGLTRDFGNRKALDRVSLNIPRGGVFGLVGENGAGKTTLIKHILGLYRAQTGKVRIFGKDPVEDPVGVLSKIGYLSEDRELMDWMRIDEFMRYNRSFYPDWDEPYVRNLITTFQLDTKMIIRNLSRGQRAQVGLLAAVAHHPDLLLLDEPSSGLDPIVRKDILTEVIHAVTEQGKTVFFSSHLLEEVERIADSVAMISKGKIVLSAPLDEIKETHHVFVIRFEQGCSVLPEIQGVLYGEGEGQEWTIVCNENKETIQQALSKYQGIILEERIPALTDIFIARAGRPRNVVHSG